MMMLFCEVLGNAQPFSINIRGDDTVGELRKVIRAEKDVTFKDIEADNIMRWKWNKPRGEGG